ncbi:MAG: DNA gyrase inhibitor YacG [Acidobacteriota bacterium]|nr:DNA gyrase inhibitor YacG [Acidobacteriota bacterium]
MNRKSPCPQCGKECDADGNPFRPFCCERCKLLDLGNWISGGYRIPETEPEEWEEKTLDIYKNS